MSGHFNPPNSALSLLKSWQATDTQGLSARLQRTKYVSRDACAQVCSVDVVLVIYRLVMSLAARCEWVSAIASLQTRAPKRGAEREKRSIAQTDTHLPLLF